ncbi:MAG: DNA topoisomerase I, partial [Chlamydiales bacterium]|nr:DNA topoisomerase I [Chlamydiales bacterium]
DVIVNDLDDLSEKYPHHPKTAYIKKPSRFAKGKKGKEASKKEVKPKKSAKPKREQKGYKVSKELEAVIGEKEISRPQMIKKIWDYIKKNNLQDPKNKKLIVPDAKLAKVFGSNKPLDMMKLSGVLGKHLS